MNTNHILKRGFLATVISVFALTGSHASANTYVWTNTAGGSWSVAANWSPNVSPGGGDTAFITNSGAYAVVLSASTSVYSLTIGSTNGSGTQSFNTFNQNLTVGSSLTVNSTGAFTLNGGTLNVNGLIEGLVFWTNGQMGSDGTPMELGANATLVLAGSNGVDYIMGQYVTNAGTIEVQSGNLALNYCTYYGGLQNLAGALIDLEGDVSIDGCGGVGLINAGTLRKSAGAGVSAIDQLFHNTGTVNVETGTLLLNNTTADANGTYLGTGAVLITNTTFSETGTLTTSNLVLAGGTFYGSGTSTIQGLVRWTGGQFGSGPGQLTLATNTTLILAGSNGVDYIFGQYVTNAGMIDVQSGNLSINYCSYYGGLQNLPGALINLEGDVSIDGCGGVGLFNQGTLVKSAGTGVSAINQTFHNTGTVNVNSGSLFLYGPSSDSNGIYNGPGATVITNGSFTETGTLTVSNLVLAGGNLAVQGTLHGVLAWTGGLIGPGNIDLAIASDATISLAGINGSNYVISQVVTNAGVLRVLSGNLYISWCGGGNYGQMINLPGALVDLAGDVSITGDSCSPGLANFGTVRKSSGTGVSAIDTPFQNEANGTLNVVSGTVLLNQPVTDNGGTYSGAGATLITNATLTVNASLTSSNIVLAGGNLTGNGTIKGLITWTGGLIGPGQKNLTIAPNATLLLNGINGSNYTISQVVTNAGVIRVLSGNLYLNWCGGGDYGQMINLPGALVDLAGNVSISGDSCSPGLANFGAVRKSSGTGVSAIDTPFLNQTSGTLDIQTGSLSLATGFSIAQGTLQFVIGGANNYTTLSLPTAATLGGALSASFTNGYSPAIGTTYDLISYPSATGVFTALEVPPGHFWQQLYNATNYALRVVAGPAFGASSASSRTNAVFTGTDGMPGSNYVVLTSTNVALPLTNWSILSTNTFDAVGDFQFTNKITPATTQRYFVILAQ